MKSVQSVASIHVIRAIRGQSPAAGSYPWIRAIRVIRGLIHVIRAIRGPFKFFSNIVVNHLLEDA